MKMNIRKVLSKWNDVILTPIKTYPIEFCFIILLLWLPSLYVFGDSYIDKIELFLRCFVVSHSSQLLFNVAVSYLIVSLGYCLCRLTKTLWGGYIFIIPIELLLFIVATIQVFLFDNFGMEINSFAFQLVDETNEKESSEFISTYILQIENIRYVVVLIIMVLIQYLYRRKYENTLKRWYEIFILKKKMLYVRRGIAVYITLCVIFFFTCLPLFSTTWSINVKKCGERNRFNISMDMMFRIYNSYLQYKETIVDINECADSQRKAAAYMGDEVIGNIVLIIGESYNRHHASLYGYGKKTNPFLENMENLFVFDDVISSINGTASSFRNFLSTASVDSHNKWCDEPLFPVLFKNAGYNVVFNSNQFTFDYNMDIYSSACGFFFHPRIRPYMFAYTNKEKYDYDSELIDSYKAERRNVEKEANNLIIHHLYGQHVSPKSRYPENQAFFCKEDYSDRKELSDEDKEYVATYDNATRYNDSIVSEIIKMYKDKDAVVIYFADHGDEANDYRRHKGRTRGMEKLGAPCLHCQLDVPFIIYTSEKFIENHPGICKRIKGSIHRPFMTDDLPHLLIDIAGLKTKWYKPSRSLINEKYNLKRRRVIKGFSVEGVLDYDKICDTYGKWKIGF